MQVVQTVCPLLSLYEPAAHGVHSVEFTLSLKIEEISQVINTDYRGHHNSLQKLKQRPSVSYSLIERYIENTIYILEVNMHGTPRGTLT